MKELRSLVSFNNFLIYERARNSDTSHVYDSQPRNIHTQIAQRND